MNTHLSREDLVLGKDTVHCATEPSPEHLRCVLPVKVPQNEIGANTVAGVPFLHVFADRNDLTSGI